MSGLMHLVRKKGDRSLRVNGDKESWKDEDKPWSLPAVERPSVAEETNYYDSYRFEAHPRSYSPSGKRLQATGFSRRYPYRPPTVKNPQSTKDAIAPYLQKMQRHKLAAENDRQRRKEESLVWNLETPQPVRDQLKGPYRSGQIVASRHTSGTQMNMAATARPKTWYSDEFAFSETQPIKKESLHSLEEPVSKHSISRYVDGGDQLAGYMGHVTGARFTFGQTFARSTRKCFQGYQPRVYA